MTMSARLFGRRGRTFAAPALLLFLVPLILGATGRASAGGDVSDIPQVIDMSKIKIEIVNALYVKKLDAANAKFDIGDEGNKYRGLVLTLRIQKPEGEELRLNAQDLSLHYRYGQESDIAPCNGVSTYSTQKDMDRTMSLFKVSRGTSATGTATTQASVVYVDLFFNYIEADTSDMYLLVAQPVGVHYKSSGWK
jgi:hypothetical protein